MNSLRGFLLIGLLALSSSVQGAITLDFSVSAGYSGTSRLVSDEAHYPLRFAFFVDGTGNVTVDARVFSASSNLNAVVDAWDGPVGMVSDTNLYNTAFEIEFVARDLGVDLSRVDTNGNPVHISNHAVITFDGADGGVLGVAGVTTGDDGRLDGPEMLQLHVFFGEIGQPGDRRQVEVQLLSVDYGNAPDNTGDVTMRDKDTATTSNNLTGTTGTIGTSGMTTREHESIFMAMPTHGTDGVGIGGITFDVVSAPVYMPIPVGEHPDDYLVYDDFERATWPFTDTLLDSSTRFSRIVDGADSPIGTGYARSITDYETDFDERHYSTWIGTSDLDTSAYSEAIHWSFDMVLNDGDASGSLMLFGNRNDPDPPGRRFSTLLYGDGTFGTGTLTPGQVYRVHVFVNDFETNLNYTGPDLSAQTLAANEIDCWLDNTLVNTEPMLAAAVGSIDNLTLVGVQTRDDDTGNISVTMDNWLVEDLDTTPPGIPAPSHLCDDTDPDNLDYGTFDNIGQSFDSNVLCDYSDAGYKGGGVPIPFVPAVITLDPIPGDDQANIQAAIDAVEAMPIGPDGFRGAVLLNPGVYEGIGILEINESGVVLRGSGSQEVGGTKFLGGMRVWVRRWPLGRTGLPGSQIVDSFVPIGATTFNVADASNLRVGEKISIWHAWNEQWRD
ncbi:MAG: hypothetical protein AAF492_13135, partial [Verrucomicrobiota bacterium]